MARNNFDAIKKKALRLHKKAGGKFAIMSKVPLRGPEDLKLVYTPGVGAVSSFVASHKGSEWEYTMKGNSVLVVSDGSAVLGLGNIGPYGALPVMEGKCLLFKKFANIDAVPLVLATQDTEAIIATVKAVSPAFGGINLEDISAPRCFEIEARLKRELDIPVMHDDQHGTAIIVLAGLLNALKVVKKKLKNSKIIISGAGAAGTAIAKILCLAGAKNIVVLDSKGVIWRGRPNLNPAKRELARITNPKNMKGGLADAMRGADVFIGVSGPNIVTEGMVRSMERNAIVFALANPIPEIMPDAAKRGGAKIIATGRSDFPNQLNNSQVFPGVFRGALDHRVRAITDTMKLKAARAIAALVPRPTATNIVPDMFDKRLVRTVAAVIR
ncbi:MAG: malate dehydrogenase [Candidatus Sungbacteria bacterium RIFCSPLOWO2_01_FULL_59_16]|uniref:Malate dehydrogenase n=1 Tax=Candidatus Sungbacteria bacterium RIFCSPLOWO2_01_FULL_59_16 TaxID=1802280 RepID=A0A1G2LBA2_9BACT|nr:MAG: malate dehydrogenase [Candidatus Sungbacteria bacterium RIFCSPLOWO2_01_FULL_59_16]